MHYSSSILTFSRWRWRKHIVFRGMVAQIDHLLVVCKGLVENFDTSKGGIGTYPSVLQTEMNTIGRLEIAIFSDSQATTLASNSIRSKLVGRCLGKLNNLDRVALY